MFKRYKYLILMIVILSILIVAKVAYQQSANLWIPDETTIYSYDDAVSALIGGSNTATAEFVFDVWQGNASATAAVIANKFCIDNIDNCQSGSWPSVSGEAAWNQIWTNTLTPTNTLAGIFVKASSTIDANLRVTGNLTTVGNVTGANLNVSNWDTAYGWGDHSSAGYLISPINWSDIGDVPTSTTDDLNEGATNLYYTQTRVWNDTWASTTLATILSNSQIAYSWGDWSGEGFITDLSGFDTGDLAEGTNLYYTQARVWDDTWASSSLAAILSNSQTAYSWGNHADANYLDLDTYPNADTDSTDDFDGAYSSLSGLPILWATDTEQYFWNNTSTWTGFGSEWNKYTNASSTIITQADLTTSLAGYMQDEDINTFSELDVWVTDAVLLQSGGTLTSGKICRYDGTGIDCDYDDVDTDTYDASWHEIWANTLTPTNTSAGIYVKASSTIDSTLRVTGNATTTGHLAVLGGNSDQWNLAYGWGDHSLAGYVTDLSGFDTGDLSEGTNLYYTDNRVRDFIQASTSIQVHFTNADIAYSWGDWSGEGFLTSVDISDNTNLVGGTNITLDDDTLNVDDAFLVNNASDETTGGLTMNSATITDTVVLSGFDCSGNDNGGVLTVGADNIVICDDDDSVAGGGEAGAWGTIWVNALAPTNTSAGIFVYASSTINNTLRVTGTLTAPAGVTANLTGNVTGNADTATALAGDPTDCSANQFANAIAASGNLTCTTIDTIWNVLHNATTTYPGFATQFAVSHNATTTYPGFTTQFAAESSTNLSDTASLLYETELDDFSELQIQIADKTLVNEEDIFTIDANWVNTANPWADNEVVDALTINTAAQGIFTTGARIAELFATSTLFDHSTTTDVVYLTHYISCTALETDANGLMVCGTDDTAAGGGEPGAWSTVWANVLAPTNTSAGIFVYASSTINSTLRINDKATTSVALWVGSAGTADKLNLSGGDLYVQDELEVDGEFNYTTTMRGGASGEPGRWRFYDSTGYIMTFWDVSTDWDTWGLYWDTTNNQFIYRGNATDRFSIDLDDGNATSSGHIAAIEFLENAKSLTDIYVALAGDTMTGGLSMTSATSTGKIVLGEYLQYTLAGDNYLYFDNAKINYLKWDDTDDRFEFVNDLHITGNATSTLSTHATQFCLANDCITVWPSGTSPFTDAGTWIYPTNGEGLIVSASSTFIGGFTIDGNATTTGNLMLKNLNIEETVNIYFGHTSNYIRKVEVDNEWYIVSTNKGQVILSDNLMVGGLVNNDDDFIYFDTGGTEFLSWDDSPGEFDLSDDLNIVGIASSTLGFRVNDDFIVDNVGRATTTHSFSITNGTRGVRIIPGATTTFQGF